jgi:hypothetical protein
VPDIAPDAKPQENVNKDLEKKIPEVRPPVVPKPVAKPVITPQKTVLDERLEADRQRTTQSASGLERPLSERIPEVNDPAKARIYSGTYAAPHADTARGAAAGTTVVESESGPVTIDEQGTIVDSDEDFLDTLVGREGKWTAEETQRVMSMEPEVKEKWKAKRLKEGMPSKPAAPKKPAVKVEPKVAPTNKAPDTSSVDEQAVSPEVEQQYVEAFALLDAMLADPSIIDKAMKDAFEQIGSPADPVKVLVWAFGRFLADERSEGSLQILKNAIRTTKQVYGDALATKVANSVVKRLRPDYEPGAQAAPQVAPEQAEEGAEAPVDAAEEEQIIRDESYKEIPLPFDLAAIANVDPDAQRTPVALNSAGNERVFTSWRRSLEAALVNASPSEETHTAKGKTSKTGKPRGVTAVRMDAEAFADANPELALEILEGRVYTALDAGKIKVAQAHLAALNAWVAHYEAKPDVDDVFYDETWDKAKELPRRPADIDMEAARAMGQGSGSRAAIERGRSRVNFAVRDATKFLIQQGYDAVDDRVYSARLALGLDVDPESAPAVRAARVEAEAENQFVDDINNALENAQFEMDMDETISALQVELDTVTDAERKQLENDVEKILQINEEQKKAPTVQRPKSAIRQRIEETKAFIKQNLFDGLFPLTGDQMVEEDYDEEDENGEIVTKTRMVPRHSDEVMAEINKTLHFFGIKPGREATKMLFRAFQLYRGFSIDRDGRMFKQSKEKVKISDDVFIQFLGEIRNNVRMYNNPFAYTNPHYKLGTTECYPMPISKALAAWFTSGTSGELSISAEDLITHSVKEYNEKVEPRLKKLASFAQREVLFDMRDVVADQLKRDDLPGRSPDERMSATEMLNADSEYAKLFNDEEALVAAMVERQERQFRAMTRVEKHKKRAEVKDSEDAGENADEYWYEVAAPNAQSAARTVANIGRIMGVIGNPFIAATGIAEKTTGVIYQSAGTWALRQFMGGEQQITENGKQIVAEDHNLHAVEEMLKIIASEGFDGLIDLASRGVLFAKETKIKNEKKPLATARQRTGQWVEVAMAWSTGDVVFKKKTARILLDHLIYQFERSAKLDPDAVTYTAVELESMLESDPNGFWSMVATTSEGRQALLFAGNTSLAGVDPLTNLLRLGTRNSLVDASLGFIIGWYLKFGMRSAIRMIPYSNTAIFLAQRGLINPALSIGVSGDTLADTNEFMLAGNESFARGMAQNIIVDTMRFGTQAATFMFCMGLVTLLGGVAPPDDDDKRHLWFEWKIGGKDGVAVKEAWYFQELLGFSMPLVIAVLAGAQTGDTDEAMFILTNGVWEKLEQNPWTNAADLIDLTNNFDRDLVEAQARAEGYEGADPTGEQYAYSQIMMWMTRRTYQTFEPAILRQAYNEHGLFTGTADLARSPNMVFTGDPNDPTDMTTWIDSQKRRANRPSRATALIANILAGYYWQSHDPSQPPLTGYMRDQMPLVENVDSTNQMWIDALSVKDPAGGPNIPREKWTPEQEQRIVNEVKSLIARFPNPVDMAAQGIVIPYDARAATVDAFNKEWGEIRSRHYKRVADGDFASLPGGWPSAADKKRKNKAYENHLKEQAKIDAKIDILFSDEIPYSALKYNRWETNYRTMFVWKDGPKKGKPAHPLEYRMHSEDVEIIRYASGDHKSSFFPWLTVDDQGKDTYDAQTQVGWQNANTDMDFVRESTMDRTIETGVNKGKNAWEVLSGEGGAYSKAMQGAGMGALMPMLLTGQRALLPKRMPFDKLDRKDFPKPEVEKAVKPDDSGKTVWRRGWGGGWGSNEYTPVFYSHPAYSLNADKPAGLYRKNPNYTRFDYLRPRVSTKGSREAYRREDF